MQAYDICFMSVSEPSGPDRLDLFETSVPGIPGRSNFAPRGTLRLKSTQHGTPLPGPPGPR